MAIDSEKETAVAPIALGPFDAACLRGGLSLSQEMGWPYRLEDWAFAAQLGEGLVLVRAGEVIGTAMSWQYGADFASVGMIIVTASAQRGGNGSRLFDGLLSALEGRNILLNSTDEGMALYQRRGFVPFGRVHQHQGVPTASFENNKQEGIRPAAAADLSAIQAFDQRATGLSRPSMVAALCGVGDTLVLERAGRLAGYAIARRFGRGYVIGPCAAESAENARRLIQAQLATLQREFVRIDVYAKDGLSGWLEEIGLKQVSQAVAMVRGRPPESDGAATMFALANQSFG
ncbi:acetyltransferase [Devosia sp. Root436]|uniref:GNAT family N-acetyltransferase n=1 Tax=Devosia sp. Root436 TaxID=1736537 RepID=UPI0006FEBDAC|nr:GNAT family N-acetyltransferase [Devosia sp. Root436]KQX40664.1 acetyltransferase [Devosia sp. Root436]